MNNNDGLPMLPEMALFVAVVEAGSFNQAANKLGMSPSTITRAVQRLEHNLKMQLLERTTRRLKLTHLGVDVFEHCKHMVMAANTVVTLAQSQQTEPHGVVRIAAPKAFARHVLSPMVFRFLDSHPKVEIHWQVTDHLVDPRGEDLDVIFHLTHQPLEGLVCRELGYVRLVACASPHYLENSGTPSHPLDLEQHQCIPLGESIDDHHWTFKRIQQTVKVKTQGRLQVNHSEIRKQAVLQNRGISLFPEFVVADELADGRLAQVLSGWSLEGKYQGKVCMQYPQTKYMPTQTRCFIDAMREYFAHDATIRGGK